MAKQENSMSGSSGNDAGARLSLLKTTLLSRTGGSISNTGEQLSGIAGTDLTPLPMISSHEDMSNSGVSTNRGQKLADQDDSGISTNEGEHVREPMNNGSSNSSSSGDILNANSSANSSSNGNQLLEGAMQKKYFCKVCDQGFTRKHNMASHELIHSSSKPHVCRVCDSKFRRIHDLKRHEKLHTGEKPFHCTKCTRRFARPDALIRHQNSPNACSGNTHSISRAGGTFFSQMVPTSSTSVSAMSSPTANTDCKTRDPDLSRWKVLQNTGQNSPPYQTYPPTQAPNNDIRTPTMATTNTRSTSDNEQQGQQFNEYYHALENREPYLLLQNQYSPKQTNPPYLPYYLPVSNSHPTHLNNPPLPHTNHTNLHSGQQHTAPAGFVTISKYQDLVAYTHKLQESLAKMDSRLKYLEDRSASWLKEDDMSNQSKRTNNDSTGGSG